ncbi:MAG: hypothetical protein LLP51_11585 [Halorhodospira halophila]|uniref:hypothetical protein n=1 Tax=Halorhodospira TaxID=85108 RepID=UPI001EE987EA|nr:MULTISPECIES: hypothetical protein [Halorhodospira]MCC3752022.1 hypothetical protein [Halorhodospira halophila]MCG5533683.1 hypothetical protein [Halorhodospira sp. 9621]
MQQKSLGIIAIVGAGVVAAGCSTTSSYTDYDERAFYSGGTAGNLPYVEIGPVEASARGFAWTSCDALVDQVADELAEQAAEKGGNALINVRWTNLDDGSTTAEPICTTGWGWFALAGVGGLHPWVRGTEARAVVVFADDERLEELGGRVTELREQLARERAEARRAAREEAAEEAAAEQDRAEEQDEAEEQNEGQGAADDEAGGDAES